MNGVRVVVWTVIGVLVFIGISVGLMFLTGIISMGTADFRGEVEKREQVEADGAYRVAEHDKFYRMCSDIQTKQDNIETLKAAGEEDAATANELMLDKLVNKYNADAANSYTKGQFRADELPYRIDADKEVASCGKP